MQYPSKLDYDNAVWNLAKTIRCLDYQGGIPKNDGIDLVYYTGGFSRVYLVDLHDRTAVLRVWISEIPDVQALYMQAQKFFSSRPNPYFVDFRFIEEGIEVNQHIWPILYMEYVSGLTLNKFLDNCLYHSPKLVETAADEFLSMIKCLHQENISHGDLQDGNIIVTNHSLPLSLKLIDYDTLYIPNLSNVERQTVGVTSYQHPKRAAKNTDNSKWDYFSELVIYLSLKAYAENPQLWKPGQEKSLLFNTNDYKEPKNSAILNQLVNGKYSDEVKRLTRALMYMCTVSDLNKLYPLEKVIELTREKEYPPSESHPEPERIYCHYCKRIITDKDAIYCPNCEKPILGTIRCPKCNKEIPRNSKFCPSCGKRTYFW